MAKDTGESEADTGTNQLVIRSIKMKRAIVTVIGKDRVGIIYEVSKCLSEININIMDISQTIQQDYFMMMMFVDVSKMEGSFENISDKLEQLGEGMGLQIRIQREEIFNSMHRV